MDLKQHIKNLIIAYRDQFKELNQKEKEESGFSKYESPLQAELIWIEKKRHNIDFQLLVFTKWDDLEDLDVMVNGPFKFKDNKLLIQDLERVTQSDKWKKRMYPKIEKTIENDPDEEPYSKIYENIITDAKNTYFQLFLDVILTDRYRPPHIFNESWYGRKIFYLTIFGKIEDLNIKEYVENEFIRFKKNKEQRKELDVLIESPRIQKQLEEQKKNEVSGYGTFIYPPKWIGEFPDPTIGDKLTNQSLGSYVKDPLLTKYKGRVLFVEKDGYIAIEEINEETAIELLNEIMGTMNFLDQGAYAVRKSEVGRATINARHKFISFKETPNICRHQILAKERSRVYRSFPKILRNRISKDEMEKIILKAENITADKDIKNYLVLYSESFGFFYEKEYTLSFLMSWSIFEKMLNYRCVNLRNQKNLDKMFKDYLDNNNWIPDLMIKALKMSEKINNNEFDYFMTLKGQRNCIIHDNSKSNYEEADKFKRFCLEEIKSVVKSLIY